MPHPQPVALVTGGSRGLGRGIVCQLARLGFSVGINYTANENAAEETVVLCRQVQADGDQRFIPIKADVGSSEDREQLFRETLRVFGRIDALINNAGIGPRTRVDVTETSLQSFYEVLRVNLEGPFFLTQSVVNYWLREKPHPALPHGFKVIFNSSISADTASLNRGEYCISKAGLAMVTQLWALRLAHEGIQVFELRPGIMETDLTRGVKEKYDRLIAEGLVPQKRWGQPEDVGLAVGAILTGDFPYSTGEVIYLDGGFHLRRL
ncbi:MAG: 3-ketoacyl-ACP reductase [Deltaproteobacteria bacterium]|nr:MAG: 3-ketoacyl-ACP reductase [Deltaproteobacteria bacterium]